MSRPDKRRDSVELVRLALVNAIEHHEFSNRSGDVRKWQALVVIEDLFELQFGEACVDWGAVARAFEIAGDPK